jgi:hypothetical protein
MFRSPRLRGIMAKIVPPRFNEGWGTWHAKIYGVDDEVIISGCAYSSLLIKPEFIGLKDENSLAQISTNLISPIDRTAIYTSRTNRYWHNTALTFFKPFPSSLIVYSPVLLQEPPALMPTLRTGTYFHGRTQIRIPTTSMTRQNMRSMNFSHPAGSRHKFSSTLTKTRLDQKNKFCSFRSSRQDNLASARKNLASSFSSILLILQRNRVPVSVLWLT